MTLATIKIKPDQTNPKMNPLNSLLFILFLCSVHTVGRAQTNIDSLRTANKNVKIAVSDILGDFYAMDSLNTKISFIADGHGAVYMEGIQPGVGKYNFPQAGDSLYVNGLAVNWPPYYCTLNLMDKHTLEIQFYHFFGNHVQYITFKK